MLREKHKIIVRAQRTIDMAITAASFIAAYFIKRDLLPEGLSGLTTDPNYSVVLLSIIIIWYVCFSWVGIYQSFREHPFSWFFIHIVKACLVGLLILNLFLFIFHIKDMSRLLLGIFFVLNVTGLTLFKWFMILILKRMRSLGYNTRNILIVGSQTRAAGVIRSIDENPGGGYRIFNAVSLTEFSPCLLPIFSEMTGDILSGKFII